MLDIIASFSKGARVIPSSQAMQRGWPCTAAGQKLSSIGRILPHQGVCGGPAIGVFTGAAIPINCVSVFLPEFDTQMLPLASMARLYGSSREASAPNPLDGERKAPDAELEAP